MNYENYLSYPKAIQEAMGHLVDWPDLEIDNSSDSDESKDYMPEKSYADETDFQNNTSVNTKNEIEDTTYSVSEDPE